MSDSQHSAEREERLREIERELEEERERDPGDGFGVFERRSVAWLISELRSLSLALDEARRIMEPLRAMLDAKKIVEGDMDQKTSSGLLAAYGDLPSWPTYERACDVWYAAMNAFAASEASAVPSSSVPPSSPRA